MNTEYNNVAKWFTSNNLILNQKKTKTEFVLFGTHQKLGKSEKVSVSLNDDLISESDSYEYLGVTMDRSLTMKEHLSRVKTYKEVLSRTKLLAHIRHNVRPWISRKDL